jgi:hypothetical protein
MLEESEVRACKKVIDQSKSSAELIQERCVVHGVHLHSWRCYL